jgi:O-antigen ligase
MHLKMKNVKRFIKENSLKIIVALLVLFILCVLAGATAWSMLLVMVLVLLLLLDEHNNFKNY